MEKDLGTRIQRLRGSVSRAEFARKYEVSPSSLVRWEKGEHPPDLTFLSKLTKDFDVSFEWLMQGEGAGPDQEAANGQNANASAKTEKQPAQPIENTGTARTSAANVSNADSPAVAMLRQEVEQLNQEIARLFQDKREMGKELRETLLELDQKSAKIEQLEGEIRRLRKGEDA